MAYLSARMDDHCKELASFGITNFVFSMSENPPQPLFL
jgi:hypothetical protein